MLVLYSPCISMHLVLAVTSVRASALLGSPSNSEKSSLVHSCSSTRSFLSAFPMAWWVRGNICLRAQSNSALQASPITARVTHPHFTRTGERCDETPEERVVISSSSDSEACLLVIMQGCTSHLVSDHLASPVTEATGCRRDAEALQCLASITCKPSSLGRMNLCMALQMAFLMFCKQHFFAHFHALCC